MNNNDIQAVVSAVLSQLGEDIKINDIQKIVADSSSETKNKVSAVSEEELPDLGSDLVKKWNGIKNAKDKKIIDDLISQTDARINKGRCGPRPRTLTLLRFLADHSRSKDTVVKNVSSEWLKEKDLFEVQTKAKDKDEYLTRPDLGRKLSDEGKAVMEKNCSKSPQVQVVLSDGLSLDAVTKNHDEILPALLDGLKSAGLTVGTPFFLRYGRVKAQDEIGQLLNAEVNLLLIGERPGLGQSESLSCYAVYKPSDATVESDRTVISNIHRGGTPPVEAAAVIVDLAKEMLAQKASGINLKR